MGSTVGSFRVSRCVHLHHVTALCKSTQAVTLAFVDNQSRATSRRKEARGIDIQPLAEQPLEQFGSWGVPVPRTAQLRVSAHGQPRVDVDVALGEDTSVTITSLTVLGSVSQPVTAAALRSLKLGELTDAVRRYVSGLHRDIEYVGRWAKMHYAMIDLGDVLERMSPDSPLVAGMASHPILASVALGSDRAERVAALKAAGPRSPESIATVAELYLHADENGVPPNKFVATILEMSEVTASRWIASAREADERIPANPRSRRRKDR